MKIMNFPEMSGKPAMQSDKGTAHEPFFMSVINGLLPKCQHDDNTEHMNIKTENNAEQKV